MLRLNKARPTVFVLALVLTLLGNLVPTQPANAEIKTFDIPVVAGYGVVVLHFTNTLPGSRVLSVTFSANYNNAGTGEDAANARFYLGNLSNGPNWTVRGSELGWNGSGTFQGSRSTNRFNGPLEGVVFWETITTGAPGSLSGRFRVVVDEPRLVDPPPCQQDPLNCAE